MNKLNYTPIDDSSTKKLGLIVLQSDVTIEDEFRYYLEGLNTSLLVTRIPFENEVTVETLRAMQDHLGASMRLFPIDAEFDALGYGCTSGALHIGDELIGELVKNERPSRYVSNPMQAVVTAFKAINANTIGYIAPYSVSVSQSMVDEIETRGIKVSTSATFDEPFDKMVGRISPASIKSACIEMAKESDVDAIFVSCTNMKCAQIIPEVEEETGVTIISSNQALAWHMLSACTIERPHGKGRLFQC